jgi:TolB-like protein
MKRAGIFWSVAVVAALGGSTWGDDRVLILPLNVLYVPAGQQWIGKGVQESLVAQFGMSGGMRPVAYTGSVIVEDNATAARLARNANAPLAIRGAAQVVGEDVRLTAQLIDSKSGETVRTGLVTGSTAELLKLEDELAGQLRGTTAVAATTPVAPASGPTAVPVGMPVALPPVIIVNQPPPVYYPIYPYSYNYPYGWNYPSGFYPLVLYQVTPGNRGHRGERDGRGNDRGRPQTVKGGGGFDPNALPIPTNNVLPIPTNNVLPIPTNNVLPIPTNNVLPLPRNNVLPLTTNKAVPVRRDTGGAQPSNRLAAIPAIAPAAPRANANPKRNPGMAD